MAWARCFLYGFDDGHINFFAQIDFVRAFNDAHDRSERKVGKHFRYDADISGVSSDCVETMK